MLFVTIIIKSCRNWNKNVYYKINRINQTANYCVNVAINKPALKDHNSLTICNSSLVQKIQRSKPDPQYTEQHCRSLETMHSTDILSLLEAEHTTLDHVRIVIYIYINDCQLTILALSWPTHKTPCQIIDEKVLIFKSYLTHYK